jgi:hypothetical protein
LRWEQRIISSTASGARYYTAHVAENSGPNSLPAESGFVTDMAKLVTSTSSDRETVATLIKEISALTNQLKAKDI